MLHDRTTHQETIGVGVAGTGFIGPAHVEGLRRNGIQVLGLAESSQEKAEKRPRSWAFLVLYGSLEEMLADPDIDVVHLATPNYFITRMPKPLCWQASTSSVRSRWR
jgi:predicted dehydrogenase